MNGKTGVAPLHSLIEICFVVLILALFGITTYTLVSVGATSYADTMSEMDLASGMRAASSYVVNRVRGTQSPDAVRVEDTVCGPALVLREDYGGDAYNTWIYYYNGSLCEVYIAEDDAFDPAYGYELATIGGFAVSIDRGLVSVTLSPADDTGRPVSFSVALRGGY